MARHPLIEEHSKSLASVVDHFQKEMGSLRSGQATPAILDNVVIEVYGVKTPIAQLASISVTDPKTIMIEPWDKNIMKEIERGVGTSDVGITPIVEGQRLRLSMPPLTEESRKKIAKIAKEKLEGAKNSLRRVRDTVRDIIIAAERDKQLSEDERYRAQRDLDTFSQEIQKKLIEIAERKEKEIMTI